MSGRRGKAVYAHPRWRYARREALARAGGRCERCGGAGRLEVHHKVAIAKGGAAYDLANLEVVCRRCHFRQHEGDRRTPGRDEWFRLLAGAYRP